jgi:hypothetical protein
MKVRGYGLILGLGIGLSLGLLPLVADEAAAQDITGENCGVIPIFCQTSENEGGDGGNARGGDGGNGDRGGNGGFASVHDIANAVASASSSVTAGDIATGDAFGPDVDVDADVEANPALTIVGSFADMGEEVVAPGGSGSAQRGTIGGNGIGADETGGEGGDGGNGRDATGGKSGDTDADQSRSVILP